MTVDTDQDSKSDASVSPQTSPKPRMFKVRDPRWLQVHVCLEFLSARCPRSENECNFAHPLDNCLIENGKVTACFDAMKGRCQREKCKYFHPPKQIKMHLEALGRTFQQQRLASLQRQPLQSNTVSHVDAPFHTFNQGQWEVGWYGDNSPIEPSSPRSPSLPRRVDKSDKLEICSDFASHCCAYEEKHCPFAHPPPSIPPDADGYVTVCMDYMKGDCQRITCRYFHPPSHLQARVRAAQRRPAQICGPTLPPGPSNIMPHQQVIFISPMPFAGQQMPMAPLVPASQEIFIPVNGYPDGSCMMPVPMQPVQPCFWPQGEPVMIPYSRDIYQQVPNQMMGQRYEMMTPPATP